MRNILFIVFFLFFSVAFSQKIVTGIVIDSETSHPLPFANVLTNNQKGTITNSDGTFEIELTETLSSIAVSYIGYKSKKVNITPSSLFYKIELTPVIENLKEVVLTGSENPALDIIRKVIENRKQNDPENILNSYKFKAYNKLLVTANPDSISSSIDSVFIKKNEKLEFKSIDSSNYELKKQLNRSHIYMTEKISEFKFLKEKGQRETILASRMAGFKEPIYEVLSLQIQSFSFYKNKYTLFGTDYVNPIANKALDTYNYRILDTINKNRRPAYMIYYFPREIKESAGLEGVLYIDSETFALQKAIVQLKGAIDIKAIQNFTYYPNKEVWFPDEKIITIRKGDNNNLITLFGGNVKVQTGVANDSTVVRTNNTDPSEILHLVSTEKNFSVELNQPVKIKGRGLEVEVNEKASERDPDYWNVYRTDSITSRDLETFVYMDSIVEAEGIEKKLYGARKLLQGYFPVKFIDFDLRNLVKYNNHEGFRLGLGVVTNSKFSANYRLNGYGVFGTKDRQFKYGFGAAAKLNAHSDTWLGINYTNDLVETGNSIFITDGRAFSLFEPRLFNITSFYKTISVSPYITHDITSKLNSRLELTYSEVQPAFEYAYEHNGEIFTNYRINSATMSFDWTPYTRYMKTKNGKLPIKQGYPQFAFQASQSFKDALNGDFNFTKFDFRAYYELKPINKAKSTFLLKASFGFGDIPVTHLYNLSPNQPTKSSIMRRFSIAGRDSFETMFFNEFFSDRYVMLQTKHFFKRFKVINKVNPEIVLISRFALGDVSNRNKHIDFEFNSLEKGYFESGLEINKIFKGFGLNAMYRYGAYHLQGFDNNFSFKFTYYFSLGF